MIYSLSGFLFEEDYTSQSVSFQEFCRTAKSAGYDGVELRRTQVNPSTPSARRRELLAVLKGSGLTVTCLTLRGAPDSKTERDDFFNRYLDLCMDLECSFLKVSGNTEWLRQAAEKAQSFGITLGQNNHVGGDLETVSGTRNFFRSVNHPNYVLLYDSLHLYAMGEDYIGCISEFAEITRNILVHSIRSPRTEDERQRSLTYGSEKYIPCLPNDEGAQDWAAILKAFRGQGYNGLITTIESGWPRNTRKKIAKHVIEYIKGIQANGY